MLVRYFNSAISNYIKNHSIRKKLLVFFLVISLIPIIIIGSLSYFQAKQAIIKKITKYSQEMIAAIGLNLGKDMKTYENISSQFVVNQGLNHLLKSYSLLIETDSAISSLKQRFNDSLREYIAGNQSIRSIVFIDETTAQKSFLTAGKPLPSDFSQSFKNTMVFKNVIQANGRMVWAPPIQLEPQQGANYVILGRRIKDISTGVPLGVFLIFIDENSFDNAINGNLYSLTGANTLDTMKTSYAIIINRDGNIVSSRFKENIGQNIKDLMKNTKPLELMFNSTSDHGSFNSMVKNKPVLVTYQALGSRGWFLLSIAPVSFLYEEIAALQFQVLILALIIGVAATLIAFWIANMIAAPLNEVVQAMKQAENGLLTMRVNVEGQDEVGFLGSSFNHMLTKIGLLITNTKQAIKLISEQSAILKESSNQAAQTAESVAVAMQQISQGTMEQTNEAEKTSVHTNNLAQAIDSMVVMANEVEKITSSTKELSVKSKDAVQLLIQKAKETNGITRVFNKNINKLNASVDKIRGITEVITRITDQTNLLALNASIEAARAGEAGRSFAVVADQINKLTEQSREAAKTIDTIIKGIELRTLVSTKTSDQTHQIVAEQMEAVFSAQNAFDEIISAMDNIVEKIDEMTDIIKKIDHFKEETLHAIVNISSISEETAAACQEVSASSQEQTAIADQAKKLADDLHNLAGKLVVIINTFKIEEDKETMPEILLEDQAS
ncbi:MAG: methyl-accepting chemotaxis protein [Firmicutes bacterium]|nr:methyl-accepting chemotaxis protein [Bacillota bacterium]